MNILIDGLPFFINKWDLGEYSKEIIHSLSKIKSFNITLIKDKEILTSLSNDFLNSVSICNLSLNRLTDNYYPIDNYMKKNKIDLYHCLNNGFSCSNINPEKSIISLHNIITSDIEDYYHDNYKNKFYNIFPKALNTATKIICLSNTLKIDLMSICGVDEHRIKVIYPPIGEIFKPSNKYMSTIYLKSKFNIHNRFILYTGDFHRRKRFEEVLEIFLRLSTFDCDLDLIFLSHINNLNLEYFNEITKLSRIMGLNNKIKFITSFTYDEKVHFFNSALCYMDLSIYDGINISLLQAFRCKCPIICSDIPINHEFLGESYNFFDLDCPSIMDDIESHIINIDNNSFFNDSDYFDLINDYSLSNSINSLVDLYRSIYL